MAMTPNPATPSPHRFLSDNRKSTSTQPSDLRPPKSIPPQSQFAPTPRFAFKVTQSSSQAPTSSSRPAFSSPLSRPRIHREDIEEPPSSPPSPPAPALPIRSPARKRQRTDAPPHHPDAIPISSSASEGEDEEDDAPTPPTTPPPAVTPFKSISPAVKLEKSPRSRPLQTIATGVPRFRVPGLPTQTSSAQSPLPTRAPVILPPKEPEPEVTQSAFFSPSRKKERYLPGGLASKVREWVVEASAPTLGQMAGVGGVGERFRVDEVEDLVGRGWSVREGMRRERVDNGEGEKRGRWLLVHGGDKGGGRDVRRGDAVAVRRPTWEVPMGEGEVWRVGVQWSVLVGDRGRAG